MSTEFESNAPSVGYRIGQIAHGLAGEELCNVRVALLCSCPGLLSACAHIPPRPEQNLNSMVCSVTTGSFHACGTASAPMVSKQPYYDGFPSPHDSRGRQHVVSIIFRLAMSGSGLGHSASPFGQRYVIVSVSRNRASTLTKRLLAVVMNVFYRRTVPVRIRRTLLACASSVK